MKSSLIFIFLLSYAITGYAQQDQITFDFVRGQIKQKEAILYFKKLDKFTIKDIRQVLNWDTIYSNFSRRSTAKKPLLKMVFTQAEKSYINTELDKFRSLKWGDSVFENGKAISLSKRKKYATNEEGQPRVPDKYGRKIYSFSKPIFLRGNTVCIFYSGFYCGISCGSWDLKIYEKQNGDWQDNFVVLHIDI